MSFNIVEFAKNRVDLFEWDLVEGFDNLSPESAETIKSDLGAFKRFLDNPYNATDEDFNVVKSYINVEDLRMAESEI